MTIKSHWITNPFFIYGITWVLVLAVYSLGWSELFPKLSAGLVFFLLATSLIAALIGVFFQKKNFFRYNETSANLKLFKWAIIVSYLLLFLEFATARGIPMLSYLQGNSDFVYTEFGLPFVHVYVVNSFCFFFIYLFHCLRSTKSKSEKRTIRWMMLFSFLPTLLMFNRGMMVACLIGAGIVYLMSSRKVMRVILYITLFALGFLLLFGLLGNLRTDTSEIENMILELGEATDEFRESPIPDPYFWAYIYVASPLSNLQETINSNAVTGVQNKDIMSYTLLELTPEFISKRMSPVLGAEEKNPSLVVSYFNVSTVYAGSYTYLGWTGMVITFLFTLAFILLPFFFVPHGTPYFVVTVAIVNQIIILNLFDNMFTFMGAVPQLLFPIVLSLKYFIPTVKKNV